MWTGSLSVPVSRLHLVVNPIIIHIRIAHTIRERLPRKGWLKHVETQESWDDMGRFYQKMGCWHMFTTYQLGMSQLVITAQPLGVENLRPLAAPGAAGSGNELAAKKLTRSYVQMTCNILIQYRHILYIYTLIIIYNLWSLMTMK